MLVGDFVKIVFYLVFKYFCVVLICCRNVNVEKENDKVNWLFIQGLLIIMFIFFIGL